MKIVGSQQNILLKSLDLVSGQRLKGFGREGIFDPLNLRNFIYIQHHFICLIFQEVFSKECSYFKIKIGMQKGLSIGQFQS